MVPYFSILEALKSCYIPGAFSIIIKGLFGVFCSNLASDVNKHKSQKLPSGAAKYTVREHRLQAMSMSRYKAARKERSCKFKVDSVWVYRCCGLKSCAELKLNMPSKL